MAKGFSIDDVLGNQSKVTRPAGTRMDIVMLPIGDIVENPENAIYEIGDVGMLQADIAEHGLRTPLEVTPAGGKYMLVAGHRRHTACLGLHEGGDARFDRLPCIVVNYASQDEELVALITSNATARELTDGERLRQYEALKGALSRLKAAGKVDGRVRDELSRRTWESTGTLGRLNAISARCIPEVKEMLARGEITMTRAYECSKLYKVQQVQYAKNAWAPMPTLSGSQKIAVIDALVKGPLKEFLSGLKYAGANEYNYTYGKDGLLSGPYSILCENHNVVISQEYADRFKAIILDPEDQTEILAESGIYLSAMFSRAKRLYQPEEEKKAELQKAAAEKSREKAAKEESEHWTEAARAELGRFDEWKKVAQAKELGLVFREYVFLDGGRMVVAVDEESRNTESEQGVFQYSRYFMARFSSSGERVNRITGERTDTKYCELWDWMSNLVSKIAEDLQARARAESD